jgi:predicted permease
VVEVMLTVVLLAGAGLLIRTVNRFASAPLGFRPEGLVTTSLRLPQGGCNDSEQRIQLYDRLQTELSGIPGMEAVAFSSARPIEGGGGVDIVEVEGHAKPRTGARFDTFQQTISPGYFRAMKTPLERGRHFERSDSARTEPVAIVNEALVRRYFPNEDPTGKHIRPFAGDNGHAPWFTIVGVVGNEKRTTVYLEMAWVGVPVIYRPLDQNPPDSIHLIARIPPGDHTFGADIQRKVAQVDPNIPVGKFQSLNDIESRALAYPRFRARLLGSFAGLALALAIVGLFWRSLSLIARRTHEIGVRMALGASRRAVLTVVLREGLLVTGTGVILGIALAWLLARYVATLLYGVQPADPILLAAIALTLVPAALIAMYLPARRASNVDPMTAPKYE